MRFHFYITIFSLMLAFNASSQSLLRDLITFDGTLTDSFGNPVNLLGQTLTFQILDDVGCVIFIETSLDGDVFGHISHRIGSGLVSANSPNLTYSSALFNSAANGILSGNTCTVAASANRQIKVSLPSGSSGLTASVPLSSVPYALNSNYLNGKTATDFVAANAQTTTLLTAGSSGQVLSKNQAGNFVWINQAASTSLTSSSIIAALSYTPARDTSATQWTTLGNNILYNLGNVGIGTTSPQALLDVAGSIRFSGAGTPAANKVLTSDALGNATWQTTVVATVTSTTVISALGYTPASSPVTTGNTYVEQNNGIVNGLISISNPSTNLNLTTINGKSVVIGANTSSTNPSSGALIVKGGLAVQENLNVSGTATFYSGIKFNVTGSISYPSDCQASEEGSQRYNKLVHAMEYCDGKYWQGISGLTNCLNGSDESYTLIGKPGSASAFCITTANQTSGLTFKIAHLNCLSKVTAKRTTAHLCDEQELDRVCLAIPSDVTLTGLSFWTPDSLSGNANSIIQYTNNAGSCDYSSKMRDGDSRDTPVNNNTYRCCYQ